MKPTPPPRFTEPLALWLLRDESGARAFPTRELAEAAAAPGAQVYAGPSALGELLDVCRLDPVRP